MKSKNLVLVFFISFLLNWLWENFHAPLYLNYQGREITELILLRATLFDAIVVSVIIWMINQLKFLKNKPLWIAGLGLVVAVENELFGLTTNRWTYSSAMPLLPLINIGLSPTVQLAVTGLLTYYIIKTQVPTKPNL